MTSKNSLTTSPLHGVSHRDRSRQRANRRVSLLLGRTKRLLELEREKVQISHGTEHERSNSELRELGRLHRTFRLLSDSMRESEDQRGQDLREYLSGALQPLKSPLTQAGYAARQLLERDGSEVDRKRWLDLVIEGLSEMEMIVANLLDQSPGQARPTHRSEVLDFVALAAETLSERSSVAAMGTQNIGFRGDPPGECLVMGDKALLKRLVLDLLASVAASGETNSDLRVSVWRHDSQVILMIESCDAATNPIQAPYQPFSRLDETPDFAERQDAALASIQHLADSHQAEVNVRGTCDQEKAFIIKFNAYRA